MSKNSENLAENAESQEFQNFLSPLPKERAISMFGSYNYKYDGFWHNELILKGILHCQKHYQPRDSDVLLVTIPKSGTTWMKAILFALINRKTHPPCHPDHPLLKNNPHSLVTQLAILKPDAYDDYISSSNKRIFQSHTPFVSLPESVKDENSSKCKIVYLCRDIKDTFISLFHFANKNPLEHVWGNHISIPLEEAFDLFRRGISDSGPIWEHILGFWKESLERPQKVLFVKYEDMKDEPGVQLRRLAEFLDCPFSEEEENTGLGDEILSLCSFECMSKSEVNKTGTTVFGIDNSVFFRKGVVGDAKNYLTTEMANQLDQITKEKFRGSGLWI